MFSQAGKIFGTELLYEINVPLDGQTRWAKLTSRPVNFPGG